MNSRSTQMHSGQSYRQSGEVSVAVGAQVAADVIMSAQVGSRIEIQAGVCIGEGSLLHAYSGDLVIAAGATLGSHVLVVGQGRIGPRASVGEGSTLLNPELAADGVIPAGSLVGDRSRPIADPELYNPRLSRPIPVKLSAGREDIPSGLTPALETEPAVSVAIPVQPVPSLVSSDLAPVTEPIPSEDGPSPLVPVPLHPSQKVMQSLSEPAPTAIQVSQPPQTMLESIPPHQPEGSLEPSPPPRSIPGHADLQRLLLKIYPQRYSPEPSS